MRRLIYIFALSLTPLFAAAQEDNTTPDYFSTEDSTSQADEQKIEFGMSVGSTAFVSNRGSMVGTFLAPNVRVPLGKRLFFTGGLMFTQSYGNFNMLGENNNASWGRPQTFLYGQGDYMLNDKWVLSGATIINTNPTNSADPTMQYGASLDYAALGLSYLFDDNSSITFSIGMNNTNTLYYNNGFAGFGNTAATPFVNPARSQFGNPFFRSW